MNVFREIYNSVVGPSQKELDSAVDEFDEAVDKIIDQHDKKETSKNKKRTGLHMASVSEK